MAKNIQTGIEIKAGVTGAEAIKQLAATIGEAGVDTAKLSEESQALSRAWADIENRHSLINQYKALKVGLKEVNTELTHTRQQMTQLQAQMADGATKAQEKEYAALAARLDELTDKKRRLGGELRDHSGLMRQAGVSAKQLAEHEKQLAAQATAAKVRLEALNAEAQRLKKLAEARVVLGLDVDDRVRQELKKTEAAYRTLRNSGTLTKKELARATEQYKRRVQELNAELQGTPAKLNPIAGSLRGLGAAGLAAAGVGGGLFAVKEGIQAILDKTREFQAIRKRLEYAFGGAEEGGRQLDFVRDIASQLGLELTGAADGYAKLAAATKDLNISHAETQQIFKGVANAAAAMGLSADETNGVFYALSQIAGKGKVSMEELRGQLGERLTPAMAIAAKSMGVTTAELEKMVEAGISAEEFLPKFGAALEQAFAADAAKNVDTLTGRINLLKNQFSELLNGFGEGGVADAAVAVLKDVGEMLTWLEERINGMDATVSGSLRDTFVSAYEAIKEGGAAVVDLFGTLLGAVNDFGNAISVLAGGSGQDFDFIKGVLDSVNITIGVMRDGIAAAGIAVDFLAGVVLKSAGLMAEGLSKINFFGLAEEYEAAAKELEAAAQKHFANAEQAALDFESKAAQAINRAAETEAQRYQRLETEARQAYQEAAQAAIDAAEQARDAHDKANAAIGTSAEETAAKQAQAAARAAGQAQAAAQKAEDEWRRAFVNIGGETELAEQITRPLRDAGLAAVQAAEEAGKVSRTLADAKGAAAGLGLDLRAAMTEPTPAMQSMQAQMDKLRRGFDDLGAEGIQAGKLVREAVAGMLKSAASEADIAAVKAAFRDLGEDGRLSMQEVEQGILDADVRLQELRGSIDPTTAAFKRLGIQTREALRLSAEQMRLAFDTAKNSGQASAESLQAAFKRAADAALASGDTQQKAWVAGNAAMYGYRLQMDEAGKASLQLAETVKKSSEQQTAAINQAAAATQKQAAAMQGAGQAAGQAAAGGMSAYRKITFDILSANLHTAESAEALREALKRVRNASVQPLGANLAWRQSIRIIARYEQGLRDARAATEALNRKTEEGTVTLDDISQAAGKANIEFGRLDKTTLSALHGAIDKARAKIQALQDEAAATRAALEADLAELQGDDGKRAALEQEAKLRELNLKLSEAERANNRQAADDYRQAIELQGRLYQARREKAAADKLQQQREAEARETAKQPPVQQVLQIGETAVPLADTEAAARQLGEALNVRDGALVQKVVQTLMQQIHDEIKRSGR